MGVEGWSLATHGKQLKDWVVANGSLVAIDSAGTPVRVSGSLIYECLVLRRGQDRLPPLGSTLAATLEFSAYPADARLIIEFNGTSLGTRLVIAFDEIEFDIHSSSNWLPDHVVVDNTWWPISEASCSDVQVAFQRAKLTTYSGPITLKQYLDLRQVESFYIRDDVKGLIVRDQKPSVERAFENDAPFTLYPYQVDALHWLNMIFDSSLGGVLADQMGLGKTVELIAFLQTTGDTRFPALIVCPSSILENWRRELTRFAPNLGVTIHHGSARTGFPSVLGDSDVVLASYDTVVRDAPLLRKIAWVTIIADEAQAIKNPSTHRARIIKTLPRKCAIAATGTPIENRLRDVWSLFDFVLPDYLGNEGDFHNQYEKTQDGPFELRDKIRPLILRRLVAEVARDLPPRIECPQPIVMGPDEAFGYESVRQSATNVGAKGYSLSSLTKLRMFCAHPALLSALPMMNLSAQSAKYARFVELLEEIIDEEEKAIVFTGYTAMIDLIAADVRRQFGVPAFALYGEVPSNARQSMVDAFSDSQGAAVMIANPTVGGVGLNITAANHVIHYTLEWNPALEDQATARAHRRGQSRPVTVHRLFYVDTVEEVINNRLARKRTMAEVAAPHQVEASDYADIVAALATSPHLTVR